IPHWRTNRASFPRFNLLKHNFAGGLVMSIAGQVRTINEDKMNAFLGKVVGDFGAALSSSLAYIGTKLGLYEAMASAGPVIPKELAERTGTVERYVREWLINQAAGGYVEYDAATD